MAAFICAFVLILNPVLLNPEYSLTIDAPTFYRNIIIIIIINWLFIIGIVYSLKKEDK